VGEDQLAFAPGVAGVDDAIDVLPLQELVDQVQLRRRFLVPRPDLELGRDDREVVELPRLPGRVVVLWIGELEQVPDGERDDVVVGLVEVLVLVEGSGQRADDVARNRGLLGDDQGLHRGTP
jgi:hypothetical protein